MLSRQFSRRLKKMEAWEGDGMLRKVAVVDTLSRCISLLRAIALPPSGWVVCL